MALDEAGAYEERGGRISAKIGDNCMAMVREELPHWWHQYCRRQLYPLDRTRVVPLLCTSKVSARRRSE